MEQNVTQEQIDGVIEGFRAFFQDASLTKNLDLEKMMAFMEPRFEEFGYRQRVFNFSTDKTQTSIMIMQSSSAIGDFVSTTGAIREIRRVYPEAHITFIVSDHIFSLAEHCPYVDEILTVNANYDPRNLEQLYSWNLSEARRLLARRYDIAFLFSFGGDSFTILLSYMSGAKERISTPMGSNIMFEDLLTTNVPFALHGTNAADTALDTLGYVLHAPVSNRSTEVWFGTEDLKKAKELLKDKGTVYAVCIGGSQLKKHYPPEYYAKFINKVQKEELVYFCILGGTMDEAEAEAIQKKVRKDALLNMAGRLSLCQTAAVLSLCKYCISNDTGTMHMAAAMGVPVLTPFCFAADIDTAPHINCIQRWYPYGVPSVIIQPVRALPECEGSEDFWGCKSDHPHCITQITPETMFRGFQLLKRQVEKGCKDFVLMMEE